MPYATAAEPLKEAIHAAIAATGVPPYKEGDVPESAPVRRAVVAGIAEPSESERGIGQRSREQVTAIRWMDETHWGADDAFRLGMAALDGVLLPLAGGRRMARAALSRVTDFPDPDPEVEVHIVVSELRTRIV